MSYQHFLWELHFILFQGPADKGLSFKDDLMMRLGIYIYLLSMINPPNTLHTDTLIIFKVQCWSAVAEQWHMPCSPSCWWSHRKMESRWWLCRRYLCLITCMWVPVSLSNIFVTENSHEPERMPEHFVSPHSVYACFDLVLLVDQYVAFMFHFLSAT